LSPLTKYIEVLQCNNHLQSYCCDVVRINRKRTGRNTFVYGRPKKLTAILIPVDPKDKKTCRECPKGARFLVRHRKY